MQRKLFILLLYPVVILLSALPQFDALDGSSGLDLILSHPGVSPDGDGIQDGLFFRVVDPPGPYRNPADWKLEIRNAEGQPVRVFRADRRRVRQDRTIWNLYMPSAVDLKPVSLFHEIYWNGRNEEGEIVSDGNYQAVLHVTPRSLQWPPVKKTKKLLVDTRSMDIGLNVLRTSIQRKGGVFIEDRDRIVIAQTTRGDGEDEAGWTVRYRSEILDDRMKTVYTTGWQTHLDELFIWKGVDQEGDLVDHGVYTYRLTTRKVTGKTHIVESDPLYVTAKEINLSLKSDRRSFSPDGNGKGDRVSFRIEPVVEQSSYYKNYNERLGVRSWQFLVFDRDSLEKPIFFREFSGPFPEEFIWDGRNPRSRLLSEGMYNIQVVLQTSYGAIHSGILPVHIDTTPPGVCSFFRYDRFTPDNDGVRDLNRIHVCSQDSSGTGEWKYTLWLVDPVQQKKAILLMNLQGSRMDERMVPWAGTSIQKPGQLFSQEQVLGELYVRDRAGNEVFAEVDHTTTGILFRPVQEGSDRLRVVLPVHGYFDDGNQLTEAGENALQAFFAKYGSHYKTYRLLIKTFTTHEGSERENQANSEIRARRVYEYLRDEAGSFELKARFQGGGETQQLIESRDRGDYYRNERIEITLIPEK